MKRMTALISAVFVAGTVFASVPTESRPLQVRKVVHIQSAPEAVEKPEALPQAVKPAKDFGKLNDRKLPNVMYLPKPEVSDEAQ